LHRPHNAASQVLEELPPLYEMPPNEVKWVERMLEYNVKGGKMNRGLMVVESVLELASFKGQTLSPREVSRFAVLGWAIEWMQAWLLMADDIMDDSPTRRGQPCWYKHSDVQKIAINDAFFVEVSLCSRQLQTPLSPTRRTLAPVRCWFLRC
jgi:farnesyl diphosphate synthase